MNEAERYLDKKNKSTSVVQSSASSLGRIVDSHQPVKKTHDKSTVNKSEKSWSVAITVLGVIATMFFMLFFKSCFARF